MRNYVTFGIIGLFAFGALAAYAEPTVVIVAWDGGKPSVIQRLIEQGQLPTLQALIEQGSYTFQAQTVLPSKTLPSFTSMLTGVGPRRHGVLWNDYDPDRGWVPVPTVFEVLKRARPSARTAMVFTKKKFRHLAKPGTLDAVEEVDKDAPEVAETAVRLIQSLRPHLLFVHFRDPDRAGHLHGWGDDARGKPPSSQFIEALRRCDRALGTIVEALRQNGLWEETLLIVTADHGGHGRNHGSSDPQDVRIPWIAAGGLAAPAGVLAQAVRTMDTAATALAVLGLTPPPDWDGRTVGEALRFQGLRISNCGLRNRLTDPFGPGEWYRNGLFHYPGSTIFQRTHLKTVSESRPFFYRTHHLRHGPGRRAAPGANSK